MEDKTLTPLFILAVSLVYEIEANKKSSRQEKAQLITLFGKLVEMNVMREEEMQTMIKNAFTYTSENDVDEFIKKALNILTDSQRLAVVINLFDTMQVDGFISSAERAITKKFSDAFGIDEITKRGIEKFLMLKNDTSIFVEQAHPLNNTNFNIKDIFGNN